MNKNKEYIKFVPTLRFSEFENMKEWDSKTINDLVKDDVLLPPKDGNHGNIHPKSGDFVNNGIPFIMANDIRNGKVNLADCKFISKKQADSLQKGFAKEEDVLLTHKGTVGEVALVEKNEFPYLMLTPQVTYYRVKDKSKLSNTYLKAYFTCSSFQRTLLNVSGGGTRAYIGITEQGKLNISIPPSLPEQQKIANTLTTLDTLIAAEKEKEDALQAHKKGLLQQLFPAKGEKMPKVRFPEFEGDEAWEVVKNSVKIISGNAYKMSLYSNEGLRLVQGANILNGDYLDKKNIRINPSDVKGQKNIIVKKGDILLGLNRPITNNKLKVCQYPYEAGYLYQRAGKLEFKGNLKRDFLFQFLCTPLFLEKLKTELVGSDQPYIKSNLFSTDILIAPKEREQQKIANTLSSLDEKIAAQSEKIAALQEHKKGLMQQLFPNPNTQKG